MTPAADQRPAAARLVAVAAAGHSDPLLLHHLKGHDLLPFVEALGFWNSGKIVSVSEAVTEVVQGHYMAGYIPRNFHEGFNYIELLLRI